MKKIEEKEEKFWARIMSGVTCGIDLIPFCMIDRGKMFKSKI